MLFGGRFPLLMLLATAPAVAHAQLLGDVSMDNAITEVDSGALAAYLVGSHELSAAALERADCNGFSGIDAGDLVWILNQVTTDLVPEMIRVPGAVFMMGDPWNEGFADERPVHPVDLSVYEIGRHKITNAEYCAHLESAMRSHDITVADGAVYRSNGGNALLCETTLSRALCQIIYSGGTFAPRVRDNCDMAAHPAVFVSWYGAAAHCNWLSRQQGFEEVYAECGSWEADLTRNGYHLPTEAQWERTAGWDPGHVGSSDYPVPTSEPALGHWRYGFASDAIDFSRANHCSVSPSGGAFANPLSLTDWPYTSPVGFYNGTTKGAMGPTIDSPSPAGCYDMSGNVYDWCHDWYSPSQYGIDPMPSDPAGPLVGADRVQRGGSWSRGSYGCSTAHRFSRAPSHTLNNCGFRIARNPGPPSVSVTLTSPTASAPPPCGPRSAR